MTDKVIIDTGPLVAMLDADESHHDWAIQQLKTIQLPFLTCEAVIAETCYLLRRHARAVAEVGSFVDRGQIVCRFAFQESCDRVFARMRKYRDTPMSFADACLVCMVEDVPSSSVFTLDSDFQTYRQANRRVIPTIAPWD
ncbi:MAG: PIN domain-containing protein [Rhodothermales bacterium]